jgi:hypothetical protein
MPSRREIVALLDRVTSDEAALAGVASASYRHQLGFEKYVLQTNTSGACLRLHHWERDLSEDEDIHSHCASFKSTILLGRLSQDEFILDRGHTHTMYRYRFDAVKGESEAHECGFCSVRRAGRRDLWSGDEYTLQASVLHRVTSVAPGTVTVSLWEPRQHDALVLKAASVTSGLACTRSGTEVSVVKLRLQEIRMRLAVA